MHPARAQHGSDHSCRGVAATSPARISETVNELGQVRHPKGRYDWLDLGKGRNSVSGIW